MGLQEKIINLSALLPEVPKPERKQSLTVKLIWTMIAVVAFLVMAVTPLYGVKPGATEFSTLQIIFASTQGTLMSLGIGPIVSAGLVIQLLATSKIINIDLGTENGQMAYAASTKVLTFIIIAAEASLFIVSGIFGNVFGNGAVIDFAELFVASTFVFLMDEMIQKGWGIGSGVSLFILAGVSMDIGWDLFSPAAAQVTSTATQFVGFIPAAISAGVTNTWSSIIIRGQLPDLVGLIATIVALIGLLYIEGVKIELPLTSSKYRGFNSTYPIKLLYVSNIPVILVSAVSQNVIILGNFVKNLPYLGWLIKYLAVYNSTGTLIGGPLFYISQPASFASTLADPWHSVFFTAFMMVASLIIAHMWVSVGGLSAHDVAKNFATSDLQIPGFRKAVVPLEQLLKRYITNVTTIGGLLIGFIAGASAAFGVYGTGIGLLLAIDITLQYYQQLATEELRETPLLEKVIK
jgi:preprotein translocase subunit SecY